MAYFALLVYTLAIYVRPWDTVPSLAGLPIAAVLTVAVVVVWAIAYFASRTEFWDLPHDKFILGVWLASVVSNLSWGWFGGALLGFSAYLRIVFYYFLIRFAIREPWQLRGFLWTVLAGNLFLAVCGIVQYHTGVGLGGVTLTDGRIRGTGIFNDPNDLALTFLMVIPFLLDVATDATRGVLNRAGALGLLAPILLAFVYTKSRGGMVAFAVLLAAHFIRRFGWRVGALVPGALIVGGLVWTQSRPLVPWEESVRDRFHAWGAALQMFKSKPLLGVGYGRFNEFHEIVAHNSFLHPLAELGMVGAFCFVGLCYWLVRGVLAKPPEGSEIASWKRPIEESVLAVLTCCLFLSRQYWVVFYTIVGMGACYTSIARREGAEIDLTTTPRIAAHIVLIILAGIAGTYGVVRLFSFLASG